MDGILLNKPPPLVYRLCNIDTVNIDTVTVSMRGETGPSVQLAAPLAGGSGR